MKSPSGNLHLTRNAFPAPRLSNRAWPWVVVEENPTFYVIQRWSRDSESLFYKTRQEAQNRADELNLSDYGLTPNSRIC